jgi:hypothetical protein
VTKDLTLNVNDNREVDAKLTVGSTSQTIEVSATALQVETSNTQLQQIADSDQLEQIPLEGRDPAGLQKLEPGSVESNDRFGTFASNGNETAQNSYMINGVDINDPALGNEGIQINPDALSEENIVSSTMNPEFARNSGAVVNQILKAGTNSLHGSGFEFYRDTFMNNGNYLSTTRPVFHQNLYGGTVGGPIFKNKFFFFLAYQGYRNRTAQTTVASTLDADQREGNFTNDSNYYNAAPNSAGLSDKPIPFPIGSCPAQTPWNVCFPVDPTTGIATVYIPPNTEWNTLASKLINQYVPAANFGGADANGQQSEYNFNAANSGAEDQGIIRIDYTPSAKDSIWATSIFQSAPSTATLSFYGGSFPGFGETNSNHYKLFSAAWTHTFSANKLNVLRGSYYRNPYGAVSPSQVVDPSTYGFSITPQNPESGLPYMGIGSYFTLGFSEFGPQPRLDTNLTYADNFTWVKGNHTLKFGASLEQFRVKNPFDVNNNGHYSYNGGGNYTSGDPLIDFALGIPDQYVQTNNGFIDAIADEIYSFAQDDWKMSSDFTFNFGMAWDIEQPYTDRQDNGEGVICFAVNNTISSVFPGTTGNTPPPGMSWPGDKGCNSAGGVPTRYSHFAPRLGFAWSPSNGPSKFIGTPGAHDLSVRAGFGVFFNRDQEEQSLQNLTDPPFVQTSYGAGDFGGSPGFINPYADVTSTGGSEKNPFPIAPITPTSPINWSNFAENDLGAFDKNYNVPYTYNYNLNIQRSFGSNLLAQIGYVGSVSHRLSTWYEGDPITAAGHAACLADTTGCASSPQYIHLFYPQYGAQPALAPTGQPWYLSIGDMNSQGSSNYNSLQASLRMSPTHGLQFTAAYTYSHALDDGSGYEGSTGANNRVRNYVPGFKYLNYGSSDFDARHRISTSYVYIVPVMGFMRTSAIAREILSGWGVAGVTALQTGNPVGIDMGTQRSLWCDAFSYFGCGDVPQTSSFNVHRLNPRDNAAGNPYFSTTSFSAEPLGTFGNTSRNYFHGPGFDYTNLQVFKDIHFAEHSTQYVQLRLEAFNVFNHANFANPVGNFSSPQFGDVTSVDYSADPNGDPSPGRAVQISGKFYF